ncbi:uncharacterized protein LOC135706866 [Ochlerotatus camptorhynchus]|uniref:uncharacterized protein LOC135706866 n=1 Tax=Ochlerotatus camptorhynchus TaxID=644619 RepID=UPI0031D98DFD
MTDCNPTKTPMEKNLVVPRDGESTQEPYRELLGTIMYVMLCTRPDLCFPFGFLGRYQQNPTVNHWQCLKRIVRYLKGTKTKHLKFVRDESAEVLVGYADADWASDAEDRKSVSGYLFTVFGNPVSWSSKKQVTVATSSSEAEYVSLSSAVSEVIWLPEVMEDLQLKRPADPVVIEDNQGAIGMAKNCESKRSKHIDIKHHFIRDHIANGRVTVKFISTEKQLADLFTKPVDAVHMEKLYQGFGMAD